ncbi:hypothetical protein OAU50_01450 [Planctomycetota bacterium]|nr:hypothetical protein [Planctomycetota bacterium]
MKPGIMLATIAGALAAGVGGGFLAIQLSADEASPSAPRTAPTDTNHTSTSDSATEDITALQSKIRLLEARLDQADADAEKPDAMADEVSALKNRIKELEARPTASNTGDSVEADSPDTESPVIEEAVNKAIEKREAENKKAKHEKQKKQVAKWFDGESKRIVTGMNAKLTLSNWQQESISAILSGYTTRRQETMARGMEAKENGTEFDWEGEFRSIEEEFTPQIEGELTASQLETFREVVGQEGGKGGLDNFSEGDGGK